METGQDRAERLNQRLRGAGRADVGSDDFNLDIEGIGEPFTQPSSSSPPAARPSAGAQYSPEIPSAPPEPNEPASSPNRNRPPRLSPQRAAPYHEEITESPVHAPGSGHRRRVPVQDASATATRRMAAALESDPIQPISLPPLNRPSRQSQAPPAPAQRTAPNPVAGPSGDSSPGDSDAELMPPPRAPPRPAARPPPPARSPIPEPPSAEEEEAEEIGDQAAAATIGRKRPRVSFQPSPELGSEESDASPAEERPAPKRPRPAQQQQQPARREPAAQKQPKRRNAAEGGAAGKKRGRPRKDAAQQQRAGSADDNVIEITVQRFVNGPDAGSDEEGGGGSEMAMANRSGETVVDVFAQVCEEVIATTLGKYEYLRQETQDEEKKRDCRVKMRAIEAFREEVSAQLLQHSIYLNHWYSLRKRIRHVQKEKLELRQEILRLKAEKEQVALRMDGVRARSEKDGSDSKHRLSASNLMHDIDLAVEQGRDAADLSSRARKEAELGNLELIISQVAEQASSNGPTGGLLHQIQDFNAFLERAAAVLESR